MDRWAVELQATSPQWTDVMARCPSAPCEEGALMIGRVGHSGRVIPIVPAIPITSAFVQEAGKHRAPEKRYRFSQPCREKKCNQWDGEKCLVPEQSAERLSSITNLIGSSEIPCAIRPECRWYAQRGNHACRICSFVTTQRD